MALSFEDEIRGYLQHSFEQTPSVHKAATAGQAVASFQEAAEFLADMIAAQGRAIIRIAQEIDQLRAAADGG